MFATTRRVVAFSVLTGISLTAIVGWVTGWWATLMSQVSRVWDDLITWMTSPVTMDHLVALGGMVVGAGVLLLILFALTDR